jgi:hypothetical protein
MNEHKIYHEIQQFLSINSEGMTLIRIYKLTRYQTLAFKIFSLFQSIY